LSHSLFPIGNLTKEKVREIARKLNLPVAAKAESQEICFIPDDDYSGFLRDYIPQAARPGVILNEQGDTIGNGDLESALRHVLHRAFLFASSLPDASGAPQSSTSAPGDTGTTGNQTAGPRDPQLRACPVLSSPLPRSGTPPNDDPQVGALLAKHVLNAARGRLK